MPIFNSLGSNYNFSFTLKALFAGNDPEHSEKLEKYLESKYQGKTVLLYKAREAIFLALKILDLPKDSVVAINGYTCYAVYKAISDAGYKTEYFDIAKADLNFSAQIFKDAIESNPAIKVLIIQNTLGYPCDIAGIAEICQERGIILIEDLAHSIGAVYSDGRKAGTVGDFTVLSFSQDKIIDAISGGALVIKNRQYQNFSFPDFANVALRQQIMDRWYPDLTFKIRTNYKFGLGKLTHKIYKSLGMLSKPMGNLDAISPHKLPPWYCGLVLDRFKNLENNLEHRKEIAKIYAGALNHKILLQKLSPQIENATNLRFPILVDNRAALISYLKNQGVHISDIWYDAPVAPKNYLSLTDYKHQCPEAENVSKKMLNLPTHININAVQARIIAEKINQWLTLQ